MAGSACSLLSEPLLESQAVDASDGLRVGLRIHSTGHERAFATDGFQEGYSCN
jgi:hypothetical protein